MEIKSYGWDTDICKTVSNLQWLVPEALTDPLGGVDHAIDRTKEKLSENEAVKNIKTEIRMPLDEYRHLISEAVKKGQRDAWDLARRVVGSADDCYEYSEINKVFNVDTISGVFNMSPLTALKIDMRYQEGKKKSALHVGDEVEFTAPGPHKFIEVYKGYVIRFDEESPRWVHILTKDGLFCRSPLMCAKTGRHNPDVVKVMASFEEEKIE